MFCVHIIVYEYRNKREDIYLNEETTTTNDLKCVYVYFQMLRSSTIQPTTTVETLVQQDEAVNEKAIWTVFRKMLFFTIMMTVAPLTSFFISKNLIFEGVLNMSDNSSYIYAAGVAVFIVHVILFAFVYVAFRDDSSSKKTKIDLAKQTTGKKD